jgi:methylmalonyl-CoA mutase
MEEANLFRVADPAAGSGAVEAITDDLCAKAWELFQKIEGEGGVVKALIRMTFQSDVATVRKARLKAVASRKDALTGSSEFPDIAETLPRVLAPLPQMPASKDNGLFPMRLAEPFEALRDAAEAFRAKTGQRPKVFLANLGTVAEFTARSIFAKNFFEAGGVETIGNDGFSSLIALVAAFRRSGARIACLCSSDKVYETDAVRAADALKSAGGFVYMAGRPGANEFQLKTSGVEMFIHVGCDVVATLAACHRRLGV